jgi:hypothetical protein
MTAVEWLIKKHFGGINNCTPDFRYHINQAKEMEKQQIIDFTNNFITECTYGDYDGIVQRNKTAEEYYNETFKNK